MKYSLKLNTGFIQLPPKRAAGFSLIEILISLVVMSIGLMGLAGLQIASLKGTNDAHYRTEASLLIMDLADRMRANQIGVAEGDYRTSSAINCSNPPTKQCDSVSCKGDELALFDRYTITCEMKKLLPQAQLEVNCDSNNCEASDLGLDTQLNKTHTLKISWKEAKMNGEDTSDGDFKPRDITLEIIP